MIPQINSSSEELAVAILDIRQVASTPGLLIYRNNLLATATKALEISYPTLTTLLGKDGIKAVAAKFLSENPLLSGDWGEWGEALPSWISQQKAFIQLPYLVDIAKLDWICHIAERSAMTRQDRESLALLVSIDAYELYLQTTSSLAVLTSNFPILEIWQAHHDEEINRPKWLILANQLLAVGNQQYILISCEKWRAFPCMISSSEYEFMLTLLNGWSFGDALDVVQHSNDFSAPSWLLKALKQCAVIGITRIPKQSAGGDV